MRGEAGADRGASETDHAQLRPRGAERPPGIVDGLRPAAEHLAPGDRHRVLQVRAAGLDDVALAGGLPAQRADERRQLGVERPEQLERHETDRGRRDVIGRLAEVDVAVGMDRHVAATAAAEALVGEVRHDLVDVHVGRRAGAGLENVDGGGVRDAAGGHEGGGPVDGRRPAGRQQPQPRIGARLADIKSEDGAVGAGGILGADGVEDGRHTRRR